MKTNTNKIMKTLKFLLVATFLTAFGFIANAQNTNESANIQASATVMTQLTITKNVDINFGSVGKNTDGTIVLDPKGLNNFYVGTGHAVGTFTIVGDAGTSIDLTFPSTITLNGPSSNTLTVTLDVNGSDVSTNQSSSDDLSSGDNITTHSTNGNYFLWVGGSIPVISTEQVSGAYTGSATFEVAYN